MRLLLPCIYGMGIFWWLNLWDKTYRNMVMHGHLEFIQQYINKAYTYLLLQKAKSKEIADAKEIASNVAYTNRTKASLASLFDALNLPEELKETQKENTMRRNPTRTYID
jgi:hypothetical protein